MAKLFIMCGPPGSGKSTISAQLSKTEDAIILSSDQLREELYGNADDQKHNSEVFEELHKRVRVNLSAGKSVIYDATNCTARARKNALLCATGLDCTRVCVYIKTELESCIARNAACDRVVPENAIVRMHNLYQQIPKLEEGFDEIITVHNG